MTLSLPSALSASVAAAMVLLAGLWLHHVVSDGLRRRRRNAALYRCDGCGLVYEDPRNVPLSACHRCGTLNEAVKR